MMVARCSVLVSSWVSHVSMEKHKGVLLLSMLVLLWLLLLL